MTTNHSRRSVSVFPYVHVYGDASIVADIRHDDQNSPYVAISIGTHASGMTLFIQDTEALVNLLAQVDMAYQELMAEEFTVDEDGEVA